MLDPWCIMRHSLHEQTSGIKANMSATNTIRNTDFLGLKRSTSWRFSLRGNLGHWWHGGAWADLFQLQLQMKSIMEPWNGCRQRCVFFKIVFSWTAQPMSTRVVSIVLIDSGDAIDTETNSVWEKKQTVNRHYTVNKDAHLSIVVIRINSNRTRAHVITAWNITFSIISWIVGI